MTEVTLEPARPDTLTDLVRWFGAHNRAATDPDWLRSLLLGLDGRARRGWIGRRGRDVVGFIHGHHLTLAHGSQRWSAWCWSGSYATTSAESALLMELATALLRDEVHFAIALTRSGERPRRLTPLGDCDLLNRPLQPLAEATHPLGRLGRVMTAAPGALLSRARSALHEASLPSGLEPVELTPSSHHVPELLAMLEATHAERVAPPWTEARLRSWWEPEQGATHNPIVLGVTRGPTLVAAVLAEVPRRPHHLPRVGRLLEAVHAPSGAPAMELLIAQARNQARAQGARTMQLLCLGDTLLEAHAREQGFTSRAPERRAVALEALTSDPVPPALQSLTRWRLTFADLAPFTATTRA